MAKREEETAEAAKSVTETLFGTLGLVDIVLGAVALYAVRTASPTAFEAFHSTGSEWADNALLLCFSALVGKIVLLAANLAALIPVRPKYRKALVELAAEYEKLHPVATDLHALSDSHAEDRALAYLEYERSPAAKPCATVRDNALCAYGAGIIAIAIACGAQKWPALALPLALLCFAWLTYNDFVCQLTMSLRAYVSKAQAASAPRDPVHD